MGEKTYFEAMFVAALSTLVIALGFLAYQGYTLSIQHNYLVTFSPVEARFVTNKNLKKADVSVEMRGAGTITVEQGTQELSTLGRIQRMYKTLFVAIIAGLFAMALWHVLRNDIFNTLLVRITHAIGLSCIVYPLGKWLLENEVVKQLQFVEYPNSMVQVAAGVDIPFIIAGFMLIVVGEIFRYGYNLQEEQKLTV